MNMAKMMKDLQKMQAKMQESLDALEVEGTSGGGVVTVRMNGKKQVLSLKLAPEAITPDDGELMEDLLIAAINEAGRRVDEGSADQYLGLAFRKSEPGVLKIHHGLAKCLALFDEIYGDLNGPFGLYHGRLGDVQSFLR